MSIGMQRMSGWRPLRCCQDPSPLPPPHKPLFLPPPTPPPPALNSMAGESVDSAPLVSFRVLVAINAV
jgi:hypothetical protein